MQDQGADDAVSELFSCSLLRCRQYSCCIASVGITAEALPVLRGTQAVPLCISVKLSGLLKQARRYGE